MKTIEINLFKFDELNDTAKQKAINDFRNKGIETSHIYDEAQKTVQAFNELFGTKEGGNSWLDIKTGHIDDSIMEMKGARLQKYLYNNYFDQLYKGKYYGKLVDTYPDGSKIEVNKQHPAGVRHVKRYSHVLREKSCVLTGVYYDNEILEPIYQFMENGQNTDSFSYLTFEQLINDCENEIRKAIDNEEEYLNSDESIIETLEANDYEFTEDGSIY